MNNPDPELEEDFVATRLPWHVRLREWWKEATGPITQAQHLSMTKAVFARLFMWMPVAVVLLLLLGAASFWFFTGWRAGDLATKAMRNAELGDLRVARLQIESARRMRGNDARILRAAAVIETKAGNPASPSLWEVLPGDIKFNNDELRERAVAMTRFGTDEQHERALEQLAAAGLGAEASARRAERRSARGDLERAIGDARAARDADDTPEHRLFLARLLAVRHGPLLLDPRRATEEDAAARSEIEALVDSLAGTVLSREALALGLRVPLLPAEKRVTWARLALGVVDPSNPALLPAARILRDSGGMTTEELRDRFTVPYMNAPLEAQAALASFLTESGSPQAALDSVSAKEAAQNASSFDARARALAETAQWEEMLALADAVGNVPDALREMTRAEAASKLRRVGIVEQSVPQAIRASVREGSLELALDRADAIGVGALADATLVKLCTDPGQADYIFAVSRDRFARRGRFASLRAAYAKASAAAPDGPAVRDYGRYEQLCAGMPVDPDETAASLAAHPTDVDHRMTHALALLRAGRAGDAWAVFDDFTVFYHELSPGHQAVIAAIAAAKGDHALAVQAARKIDVNMLAPGEYLLVGELRAERP